MADAFPADEPLVLPIVDVGNPAFSWAGFLAAFLVVAIAHGLRSVDIGRHRMWMRASELATAAVLAVGITVDGLDVASVLILSSVVWTPGVVMHRPYLADQYADDGRFRVLGIYWAMAAVGAALPIALAIVREPNVEDAAVVALGLGIVAVLVSIRLPSAPESSAGIQSRSSGWGRRSAWFHAALGALVVVAVDALLVIMVETWNIDTRGRLAILAGSVMALAHASSRHKGSSTCCTRELGPTARRAI